MTRYDFGRRPFAPRRTADAAEQIDLPAFELLFEQAEAGALAHVEDLVDLRESLGDRLVRGGVFTRERVERGADRAFVGVRVLRRGQAAEILNQTHPALLMLAAHVLQSAEAHDEIRVLLVGQLQLILRLQQRVGLEHPVELARRDRLGRARRDARRLPGTGLLRRRHLRSGRRGHQATQTSAKRRERERGHADDAGSKGSTGAGCGSWAQDDF